MPMSNPPSVINFPGPFFAHLLLRCIRGCINWPIMRQLLSLAVA